MHALKSPFAHLNPLDKDAFFAYHLYAGADDGRPRLFFSRQEEGD